MMPAGAAHYNGGRPPLASGESYESCGGFCASGRIAVDSRPEEQMSSGRVRPAVPYGAPEALLGRRSSVLASFRRTRTIGPGSLRFSFSIAAVGTLGDGAGAFRRP
jgi:hypothetical protein